MWMIKCLSIFFLFLTHIEKTRRELSFRESFPMWHIAWLLCRLHLLIILFYISSIMFQWWWMWIRNKKIFFFHEWNLRRDFFLCAFEATGVLEFFSFFIFYCLWRSYKVALCVCINDYHFPSFTEFQMNIYVFNGINWLRNWKLWCENCEEEKFWNFCWVNWGENFDELSLVRRNFWMRVLDVHWFEKLFRMIDE